MLDQSIIINLIKWKRKTIGGKNSVQMLQLDPGKKLNRVSRQAGVHRFPAVLDIITEEDEGPLQANRAEADLRKV